jgi:Fe-S oxidoreductase
MPKQFEEHGASCAMPTLNKEAVERVFNQDATMAYLPDCKLMRANPEMVLKIGALLARATGAPLRLLSAYDGPGCCGFELKAAGLRDDFDAHMRAQVDYWNGVTHVITDCAPMVAQKRHPARFLIDSEVAAVWPEFEHVIERLAIWAPTAPPTSTISVEGAMLHDSCFVGRHLELYEATRTLARVLFGQDLAELDASREQATCCGGANLYERINPQGAAQCSRTLVEQVEREGGTGVVCGQRGCAAQLGQVSEDVAIDLMEAACLAYEIQV